MTPETSSLYFFIIKFSDLLGLTPCLDGSLSGLAVLSSHGPTSQVYSRVLLAVANFVTKATDST